MTTQQEQLPTELQGIDVDAPNPNPNPDLQGEAPKVTDTGWKKMKCFNLSTGDFVGYLANSNSWAFLTQDEGSAANLAWSPNGADMYLQNEASPSNRYLGLGTNSYACWGLWTPTGWVNAVLYNQDHTISLKAFPSNKLYGPYGNGWVCFSGGEDNQNILRFELG
jgi:hypothetical protein